MVMEELSVVGGCQVVERLKDDGKKIEMDALRDGEPMEVFEDRGDVFEGGSTGEETIGRVLDVLEPVKESGR